MLHVPQVLWGVSPAVSAGDIPSVPTLPPALRPQEGGQGRPCGETAVGLQGSLPGLQQKGARRGLGGCDTALSHPTLLCPSLPTSTGIMANRDM